MSLATNWNSGGDKQTPSPGKKDSLRDILHALTGVSQAQMTALKSAQRSAGMQAQLTSGLRYTWNATSTVTADAVLVVAADDAPAAGRWLLVPGQDVELSLAVVFGTADAAVLYTVPTGAALLPTHAWWDVSIAWTGGTSSAIGISSDAAGAATQGDLLGGAAGDLLADLTVKPYAGTVGAVIGQPVAAIAAGEIVRFDRIVSAFTAGAANVRMVCRVLANAGA